MKMRTIGALAFVLGAGLTGSIALASGLGGGPGDLPRPVAAGELPTPAPAATATRAKKGKRQRVVYLETPPQPIKAGESFGQTMKCPRRHHGLSTYYFPFDLGVLLEASYRVTANGRVWSLSVYNSGDEDSLVSYGIVCERPLKTKLKSTGGT